MLSRRELLEVGWGGCPPSDHGAHVHLSRLRRKVIKAGGPRIGVPVPGVGYRVGSADTFGTAGPTVPIMPTTLPARAPRNLEPDDVPEPFRVPQPA